jgi:hypothetical protein
VHLGERIARAKQQLLGFVSDLIADAAQARDLRDDEDARRTGQLLPARSCCGRKPAVSGPPPRRRHP